MLFRSQSTAAPGFAAVSRILPVVENMPRVLIVKVVREPVNRLPMATDPALGLVVSDVVAVVPTVMMTAFLCEKALSRIFCRKAAIFSTSRLTDVDREIVVKLLMATALNKPIIARVTINSRSEEHTSELQSH